MSTLGPIGLFRTNVPDEIDYGKKLFLVVDSIPEMRMSLSVNLASFGANRVEFASKASDALSKMQKNQFDIVLCDYDLGHDYDGLNLLDEAKHRNLLKQSCVFMIVTSERRAANVMSVAEMAPDGYLLKPFSGGALRQRLDRTILKKKEFKIVDDAILNHEYLRAITECDQRIQKKDPYMLDFMKLKGRYCLLTGDYANAKKTYEEVLKLHPLVWAKLGLARAQFHLAQFPEAKELLEAILEENNKVMEAYDLLAQVHGAYGDAVRAQELLQAAAELSPSILRRQKQLAEIAKLNGDYETAENAIKKCIQLARYSFWREAGDYADLVNVQLERGDIPAANASVHEVRRDFKYDKASVVLSTILEANVAHQAGHQKQAEAALEQAQAQASALAIPLPDVYALELARACYKQGKEPEGETIIRGILRNASDKKEIVNRISDIFMSINRPEVGEELIQASKQSIIQLNNRAVQMAQLEGNLEGAVQLLTQAVSEMPGNVAVTLNAVNAILAFVSQKGMHESYMQTAREYLDRVRQMEPTNGKFQNLLESYKNVMSKFGINKR